MAVAPTVGHILQSPEDADEYKMPRGTSVTRELEATLPGPHLRTTLRYLGVRGDMNSGPEAFLAQVLAGDQIESHFHRLDQYQVMFGQEGSFYQRHPMAKVLVHYEDAYSVYGPFGAGPDNDMRFFTLRPHASDLHGTMPESRDLLLYRGERHHHVDVEPMLERGVPAKGEVDVDTLIAPQPDGLAAYLLRVGPGSETRPPEGELRTGRYSVVLEGELHYENRSFGPKSLGWSSGEVQDITFEGGPDGAMVLFLHFPYPSTPSVRLANAEN